MFIWVFKREPKYEFGALEVWVRNGSKFHLFRTYPICRWSGEVGPRLAQGDGQTPEGFYWVNPGGPNPCSNFHLSFDIGYPNAYGRKHGCTGRDIMVHGNCVAVGCLAMGDTAIEKTYLLALAALQGGEAGFPVHIFPFRMTNENINAVRDSKWWNFWRISARAATTSKNGGSRQA